MMDGSTSRGRAAPEAPRAASQPFQDFVVRFAAGERVFTEGDLGITLYVIQSGKVRLFRTIEGQKRVYHVLEKGDFFGEASVLEGVARTVSAEAIEDVELIEINGLTFERMIKGNIEIAVRMLRKLSGRLREAERQGTSRDPAVPAGQAAPRAAVPASPPALARSGTGLRLEVEGDAMSFPLPGDEAFVGRYDPVTEFKPDVDLTPVDLKRSVSRRHAKIVRTDEGHFITEEVGALNGTFVNGTRLVTGRPQALADGDRIGVGMVKLVFRT